MVPLWLGDSTDQEYEITADMMVHDLDDETTMDEEELMADKEEFNENELSELQKLNSKKKTFFKILIISFDWLFLTKTFSFLFSDNSWDAIHIVI